MLKDWNEQLGEGGVATKSFCSGPPLSASLSLINFRAALAQRWLRCLPANPGDDRADHLEPVATLAYDRRRRSLQLLVITLGGLYAAFQDRRLSRQRVELWPGSAPQQRIPAARAARWRHGRQAQARPRPGQSPRALGGPLWTATGALVVGVTWLDRQVPRTSSARRRRRREHRRRVDELTDSLNKPLRASWTRMAGPRSIPSMKSQDGTWDVGPGLTKTCTWR